MLVRTICEKCGSVKSQIVDMDSFTVRGVDWGPAQLEGLEMFVQIDGVEYRCELSHFSRHIHMFKEFELYDLTFKILRNGV